jgi:hypothetical protein
MGPGPVELKRLPGENASWRHRNSSGWGSFDSAGIPLRGMRTPLRMTRVERARTRRVRGQGLAWQKS